MRHLLPAVSRDTWTRRRRRRARDVETPGEGTRPLALNRDLEPGDPRIFRHHCLTKASVQDELGEPLGSIIYCGKCYSYFHKRFFGLAERCTGRANPSAASLLKRGRYPSGRPATRNWTIGHARGVSSLEGLRLGHQLSSVVAYGGPTCPRPKRLLTKTTRGLRELLSPTAFGQPAGLAWPPRRTHGEQTERVAAFLRGAGLSAAEAEAIGIAERQRLSQLRAAASRKRTQGQSPRTLRADGRGTKS